MSRTERMTIAVLILLLLLGLLFWRFTVGRHTNAPSEPSPVALSTSTLVMASTAPLVVPSKPLTSPVLHPLATGHAGKPKSSSSKTAAPLTTPNGKPVPPKIELHKELIPKNIEIVRCYYAQDVVAPGTTFGFDINGSGFTSEFEKMIKVESGQENVRIKNFHLITANQIHGDMEVGPDAKTGFVFPRVLIQKLPVFSAPEPFGIVRKGEVLTVFFTSMEPNGRGGRFRIITNLNDKLQQTFQIVPSTPGIKVSDLKAQLPFIMDGHLDITPGVPPGDHGLTVMIEGQDKYSRMGMIRIVHPNIGQSGFIQGLTAEEKYHRPGDAIQIYVEATGLSTQDPAGLTAKVEEADFGISTFTYLSPLQLRLTFNSPSKVPSGSYSVQILNTAAQVLYEKKNLFVIVPANWVAGVQVSPPVKAGGKSTLKILGRDFSEDFVASFKIDLDEPGIIVSGLHRADASTLAADIAVNASVAPGDYWLHLSAKSGKIDPPYGSIIKVEAAQ